MDCVFCSTSLNGRPCIFVDSEPYCFRCAKEYERDVIESAKRKYEKELKIYQEKRLAFKKRHPNFDSDMPIIEGSDVVTGVVGWLVFPVIGSIVGVMGWQAIRKLLWTKEQTKLNDEFESKNKMPIQPKPVEIDLELDETHFAEPVVEKSPRRRILERDDYTCQNCEEQKSDSDLEIHHIQIKAKGGTDHPTNLITLCKYCHDRERWFGHIRMWPTTLGQSSNK